jgi:signal recognition particle subunit SRP54
VLKQHRQMADAFKMMSKNGGKGFGQMAKMLGGPGGMDMGKLAQLGGGKAPSPEELEALQKQLGAGGGGLKLPGLGGLPPGFNPFKK